MYFTKEPLSGNSKAKFILIKDQGDLEGQKIFKTILKKFLNEKIPVTILCYDGSVDPVLYGVSETKDNIRIIDCFSDLRNLFQVESNPSVMSIEHVEQTFQDFKGLLCFYSLSTLLLQNSVNNVYRTINKLLNMEGFQALAILHSNVHSKMDNDIINRIASTTLHVTSSDSLNSTVHYSSGKVTSVAVDYKISDSFEFVSFTDVKVKKKSVVKQPDPTANLTFNLRLKDEEKVAREKVELPYLKMQSSDIIIEDDMYDEDDPDDDLDI